MRAEETRDIKDVKTVSEKRSVESARYPSHQSQTFFASITGLVPLSARFEGHDGETVT